MSPGDFAFLVTSVLFILSKTTEKYHYHFEATYKGI
jgi:hypothetical protein